MQSIRLSRSRRKKPYSRSPLPVQVRYRREYWGLGTESRYRWFATVEDARAFIRRVSRWRSKGGRVHALLQIRDGTSWRDLPLDEVANG
jgi:hypothetical protein